MAAPLPPLVTTESEVAQVCQALQQSPRAAFDTEFHSERTYAPRLMLVQVATDNDLWVIDPLAGPSLQPLFDALARPGLVVVGHALRNDLRIAWLTYRVVPSEVFDTQVAAAFLGHGLQVGLGTLLEAELGVHQPKGDQMADWSQRPLPERLHGYAAGDVRHLLELHDCLSRHLQERGRLDWVHEECAELSEPTRHARDPDSAFHRLAGSRRMDANEAGVLYALAEEREAIAQQEDMVPHFLLPDEVLQQLARHAPNHRRDLDADRRFQHRAVHRYAERWLAAIARGRRKPLHRPSGRPPPAPELDSVAALMMLLVQEVAQKHELAPALLVKRDMVLNALRSRPGDAEALALAAELHGWRKDLLAEPLWGLLDRRLRAQVVDDGKVGMRVVFVEEK
jgi:ribonuclease D